MYRGILLVTIINLDMQNDLSAIHKLTLSDKGDTIDTLEFYLRQAQRAYLWPPCGTTGVDDVGKASRVCNAPGPCLGLLRRTPRQYIQLYHLLPQAMFSTLYSG